MPGARVIDSNTESGGECHGSRGLLFLLNLVSLA